MAKEDNQGAVVPIASGAEKAGVLLLTLGEDIAAEVLQHMTPKEVQMVGSIMASMRDISRPTVEFVINDFFEVIESQTALGIGNDSYVRGMLEKALGDKAGSVIDRILMDSSSKGLESLKWMDPKAVAEIIRMEHPQIIAIVLCYLEADNAAQVLSHLPENIRGSILMRVATLEGVQPAAIKELDASMEEYFIDNEHLKSSMVGGVKAAADIVNLLDGEVETAVLGQVRDANEALAAEIEDLMLVFDDLREVDDRGIQTMMREVSTELLALAMKGVDDEFQQKFLKNMSSRAADMLLEDMEAKGPVKLSAVEEAQKEIVVVARRLEESGEITLGGASEEMV